MADELESGMTLGDVWQAIRSHWTIVAISVFVAVVFAVILVAVSPKTYQASAVVTINPILTNPFSGGPVNQQVNSATEAAVVTSTSVADLAREPLGVSESSQSLLKRVSVESPLNSQALVITFKADSADAAAAGANAFANAYLTFRGEQAKKTADQLSANLGGRIADLEKSLKAAANSDADTQKIILDDISVLRQQKSSVESLAIDPGTVVDTASPPTAPSSPRPKLYLAAAGLLGLVVGVALALLAARRDDRLRTVDDLRSATGVGLALEISPEPGRSTGSLIAEPRSAEANDIGVLRSKLQAPQVSNGAASFLVVGDGPAYASAESTWVAVNLAASIARGGFRAALVTTPVSAHYLERNRALLGLPGADNLRVGTAVDVPFSPGRYHKESSGGAVLVVDSAAAADAGAVLSMAAAVEAVLVVATKVVSTRRRVATVVDDMAQMGPNVVGAVLSPGGRPVTPTSSVQSATQLVPPRQTTPVAPTTRNGSAPSGSAPPPAATISAPAAESVESAEVPPKR